MPRIGFYTLNVGHGLCQVVLLPQRRAIVIDGGSARSKQVLESFLRAYVDIIVCYIATHNDEDHVGAARHVLAAFPSKEKLKHVVLLLERGSSEQVPLVDYLLHRERTGTVGVFRYGVIDDALPLVAKEVYSDAQIRLELLGPRMAETIPAVRSKGRNAKLANRMSMILRLVVGRLSALITGDADLAALSTVVDKYGFSLEATILTVPHHGGHIYPGPTSRSWHEIVAMVQPTAAIVSSGQSPPVQQESIQPFADARIPVCCTQLTKRCHEVPGSLHPPGLCTNVLPTLPPPPGQGPPCFGSILVEFGDQASVRYLTEHQNGVGERVSNPLCRRENKAIVYSP